MLRCIALSSDAMPRRRSSKTTGGYDDGRHKQTCAFIQKPTLRKDAKAYFETDEWYEVTKWDRALHQAVNASLDRTIDGLGRSEFERNLQRYVHLQKLVVDHCLGKVRFPCSSDGQLREETDCLRGDIGCGFDCIDEAISRANV